MKKKQMILRCAKLLCLILCVAVLSGVANDFCRYYDYNVTKLAGFYKEPEDSLDVVFLGASEVFTGFSSAYAYDLYGFTSYPYCQDASSISLYESQLKEILKHQDPKWIVVEINGALYDDPAMLTDSGGLRRYVNNMPFSWNKIEMITRNVPPEEWYYHFFPLAKSHSNWKEAWDQGGRMKDLYQIKLEGSLLKGNVLTVADFEAPPMRDVTQDLSRAPMEPESEKYLRSFLEYCRDSGIDNVLFVRFPHIIADDWNYGRYQRGNEAEQIILEYGYPFVNMEREYQQIGLDFAADFYNIDHLNANGQKKLTEYFGRILVEDFGVGKSQLSEENRQIWEAAAEYGYLLYDLCEEHTARNEYGFFAETRDLIATLDARKNG